MRSIEEICVLNERAAAQEMGDGALDDVIVERYAIPDTIERIYAMARDEIEKEYLSATGSR